MRLCRKVFDVIPRKDYYAVLTDSVEIRLYFLSNSILRIRAGFDGDFCEESYTLATVAWEDRMDEVLKKYRKRIAVAGSTFTDSRQTAILESAALKVVIEKEPFRICVYDREGTMLHADIIDLAYEEDSNHRRVHTSEITEDDCFYGFGETTGPLNKAMEHIEIAPGDCYSYDAQKQGSLYKHIPFYIKVNKKSRKAVGYFYHTTYRCEFDMGKVKSNYWKKFSRYRADGGDIDLFLIAGPAMSDVIERYTDLTGKSALLPRYALGYLGSSMYYPELPRDADDGVLDFVDTVREEKIPMDGFMLSSGFCNIPTPEGLKRCVFTWNKERFKDPGAFFGKMQERGIPIVPNIKPGFLLVHPRMKELKEKALFIQDSRKEEPAVGRWWGGPGYFVDFTNPKVRREWKKLLTEYLLDLGVRAIWNDNCEYDSIPDQDSRCDFEGKGGTIGRFKAVMANLMCQTAWEAIHEKDSEIRPYIICRSGHAGIQRYAQTWAGDNCTSWDTLKYNIATVLGMGLSGVAHHGTDICGFAGECPDRELLIRWVQHGIFQPRFSIHSANSDNTVTEPWMYRDATEYIRSAIEFRYQLSPYLYSLARRAYEKGLPIVEAMAYAFQQDIYCYEESIDFMLGDSLLVASIVEPGVTEREIYLPEDETFYDFYTRERYLGGQKISVPVTMDHIPLFIRDGGIVPLSEKKIYSLLQEPVTSLHLLCAGGRDGQFVLYEDDGITLNYEKGEYFRTRIVMKSGEHVKISFGCEGSYETQIEDVCIDLIRPGGSPFYVMVDGKELPHYVNRKRYEAAKEGWYYSPGLRSALMKYKNPKKEYTVEASFENYDLIGM